MRRKWRRDRERRHREFAPAPAANLLEEAGRVDRPQRVGCLPRSAQAGAAHLQRRGDETSAEAVTRQRALDWRHNGLDHPPRQAVLDLGQAPRRLLELLLRRDRVRVQDVALAFYRDHAPAQLVDQRPQLGVFLPHRVEPPLVVVHEPLHRHRLAPEAYGPRRDERRVAVDIAHEALAQEQVGPVLRRLHVEVRRLAIIRRRRREQDVVSELAQIGYRRLGRRAAADARAPRC